MVMAILVGVVAAAIAVEVVVEVFRVAVAKVVVSQG